MKGGGAPNASPEIGQSFQSQPSKGLGWGGGLLQWIDIQKTQNITRINREY
jgi:hypothetical protein